MNNDFLGWWFKLGLFVILFVLGWSFGRHNERKHLAQLERDEQRLAYIHLGNSRTTTYPSYSGQMISSSVVISHDYFKYVLATVQNFFGGRLKSYESIVERARREAIVRLKLEAEKMGATYIEGLRLATTDIGMDGGMVEVFAYGTAIKKP